MKEKKRQTKTKDKYQHKINKKKRDDHKAISLPLLCGIFPQEELYSIPCETLRFVTVLLKLPVCAKGKTKVRW